MIDVLLVGAGMTNAVICSALRSKYRILVLDVRPHLGGLLHDVASRETHIPQHGTWYLDESDADAVEFLAPFTRFSRVLHNADGLSSSLYPQFGWSLVMRQMFAGAEVMLGCDPGQWFQYAGAAKHVFYSGRLDLLPWPALDSKFAIGSSPLNEYEASWLSYYAIRSQQLLLPADRPPVSDDTHGRILHHRRLTGGESAIATFERRLDHHAVLRTDPGPSGPDLLHGMVPKAKRLRDQVAHQYPRITLAGHLATFEDMTIGQSIRAARALAASL